VPPFWIFPGQNFGAHGPAVVPSNRSRYSVIFIGMIFVCFSANDQSGSFYETSTVCVVILSLRRLVAVSVLGLFCNCTLCLRCILNTDTTHLATESQSVFDVL